MGFREMVFGAVSWVCCVACQPYLWLLNYCIRFCLSNADLSSCCAVVGYGQISSVLLTYRSDI
jgi:hypothetical protein